VGVAQTADSLFFAIRPDEGTAARIASCTEGLRTSYGLRGKPIAAGRLHITLHFLGSFQGIPQAMVAQAIDVARFVHAAPFGITLDRAKSFYSRKERLPLVLESGQTSPELKAFQRNLNAALKQAGLRNELRGFTPHLTLLYDEHRVGEHAVPPIEWAVTEFVLVHSFVGHSRHEVLGRWPLKS
jgi:RNA 2',3'-cyclic 3'-phosphodiesterase